MKQIVQNLKTGETVLEEVPVPAAVKGRVLIRTSCSLVSLGTERMLVDFGKANWVQKARQVLDKVRTDGLLSRMEEMLNQFDEILPLDCK